MRVMLSRGTCIDERDASGARAATKSVASAASKDASNDARAAALSARDGAEMSMRVALWCCDGGGEGSWRGDAEPRIVSGMRPARAADEASVVGGIRQSPAADEASVVGVMRQAPAPSPVGGTSGAATLSPSEGAACCSSDRCDDSGGGDGS